MFFCCQLDWPCSHAAVIVCMDDAAHVVQACNSELGESAKIGHKDYSSKNHGLISLYSRYI